MLMNRSTKEKILKYSYKVYSILVYKRLFEYHFHILNFLICLNCQGMERLIATSIKCPKNKQPKNSCGFV